MKWHECSSCLTEFRVVSDRPRTGYIEYCPFCGADIEDTELDDEDLDEEYDEY